MGMRDFLSICKRKSSPQLGHERIDPSFGLLKNLQCMLLCTTCSVHARLGGATRASPQKARRRICVVRIAGGSMSMQDRVTMRS